MSTADRARRFFVAATLLGCLAPVAPATGDPDAASDLGFEDVAGDLGIEFGHVRATDAMQAWVYS